MIGFVVVQDVFDDLINRFPAFWVENLLNDLLASSVSAPNMYLKSESFRYLNLLYSKRKGLPQPAAQLLSDAVPRAVDSLVALSATKGAIVGALFSFLRWKHCC
jgi:hypothetical protein